MNLWFKSPNQRGNIYQLANLVIFNPLIPCLSCWIFTKLLKGTECCIRMIFLSWVVKSNHLNWFWSKWRHIWILILIFCTDQVVSKTLRCSICQLVLFTQGCKIASTFEAQHFDKLGFLSIRWFEKLPSSCLDRARWCLLAGRKCSSFSSIKLENSTRWGQVEICLFETQFWNIGTIVIYAIVPSLVK